MKLTKINIFPVKSLSGISLETSLIDRRGLRNDRRWMLVNESGKFLTQREIARMSLVKIECGAENFTVFSNGTSPFQFPLEIADGEETEVVIWNSTVKALAFGKPADDWFSDILDAKCRLVFMPESSERSVNEKFAVRETDIVNFADGYPFMLLSESSLDDLNSRLAEKVPMNRFRPNFVVSGSDAFAEDVWKKIRIGETVFDVVKPCERCVITTIDQQTAVASKEPLRSLSQYRNFNGKVHFGQNLIAENYGGTISVGDEIEVIA